MAVVVAVALEVAGSVGGVPELALDLAKHRLCSYRLVGPD